MSMPPLGEYSEPVGLPTEMLYACDNVARYASAGADQRKPADLYACARGEAPGNFALKIGDGRTGCRG